MLAAVPIKPFGVAKRRLQPVLDAASRSRLGKAVARHTIEVLSGAGLEVAVITADEGVASWAAAHGAGVISDPDTGLNAAARAGVAAADGPWALFHADLPILGSDDVDAIIAAVPPSGVALAPAADGGTNVIAGSIPRFEFSFGPGSFARHLATARALPHAIVSRPGLALDLDTPRDLHAARQLAESSWLAD